MEEFKFKEYKSDFTKFNDEKAKKEREEIKKLNEKAVEEIRKSGKIIKSNEELKKQWDDAST